MIESTDSLLDSLGTDSEKPSLHWIDDYREWCASLWYLGKYYEGVGGTPMESLAALRSAIGEATE